MHSLFGVRNRFHPEICMYILRILHLHQVFTGFDVGTSQTVQLMLIQSNIYFIPRWVYDDAMHSITIRRSNSDLFIYTFAHP